MAEDPLTVHARQRVGRVLRNKWTLDRLIGVGGMAAVYEATHRNGSKVAIKMLHPTLMFDTNFAHRLVQEGYVANKINHPAAVRVFDDDTDEVDGAVFLVMELLTGNTLSALRRQRKRFPELEAFKMMLPVLEALGSAHDKKIIHRDIKPENLFVTRDGLMHVLDFGIARISDGSSMSQTRTGMVVGSPAYMSPEQALGKMNAVGPQTDVYAVGATLFALISGQTPHAGESTQEMIVMVATQPARSLSTVMPDAHPSVVRVVDKALSYEHNNRFADASAMLEAMRGAIDDIEGNNVEAQAPAGSPGAPRSLPTFADDDDEGETRVAPALNAAPRNGAPPANHRNQAPAPHGVDEGDDDDETGHRASHLPAAGANRVGVRPETGQFKAPSTPQAPTPLNSRMRPPTLAPTGAPSVSAHLGGIHASQHSSTGPAPFGAPPMAPMSSTGPGPMGQQIPQTQQGNPLLKTAIGGPNFAELVQQAQQEHGVNSQPGLQSAFPHDANTSGPRPGVTTGMAWAAPPEMVSSDEEPPRKSPTKFLIAGGALVALLGIGFAAKTALSTDPVTPPDTTHAVHQPTPNTPPVANPEAVRPNTPPAQVLANPTTPPVVPAHVAAPVAVNNAHAPLPATPTPNHVQQTLTPTPAAPVAPVAHHAPATPTAHVATPPVVNPTPVNPTSVRPTTPRVPATPEDPRRPHGTGHGTGHGHGHGNTNSNPLGY